MCSCTGAAGLAETLVTNGYYAWAKAVNDAGGVNGHQIQIIKKDDQTNPGLAVTAAHDLVSQGVVAVEGSSLVQQAWLPVFSAAKIPIVGESFGIPGLPQNNNVFDPTNTLSIKVGPASQISLAKAAGVTKLADMYEGDTASNQLAGLKAALQQEGTIKLVYSVKTALAQTSYSSECIAARQAGADGVILGTGAPTNIQATVRDCARQNYHPAYFGSVGIVGAELKRNTWSSWSSAPYFVTDNPAIKEYRDRMDKYFPGQFDNPAFDPNNSVGIYAGGVLLEHALKAANISASSSVTAADVYKGLYALNGDDLGGLAPPLTFKEGQVNVFDCWFESHWDNGTPKVLNDGKAKCI
jgi:branched-chain amino acid transport system substrate-binding protein